MKKWLLFFVLLSVGLSTKVHATVRLVASPDSLLYTPGDTLLLAANDSTSAQILSDLKLAFDQHQPSTKENVKAIATALAIPFPFGIIGLHRIYLGCPPWIPIVYLVTFGGCFGILPLVDCIVLLTADDATIEKKYKNNSHFFMWVN